MYKLVFSDLDETLIVDNRVPAINQKAIQKAQEKGVKFCVCTGRSYNMIDDILKDVGTYQRENEYSVCFNGGLIMENKNYKILHFHGLDYQYAQKIFDEGKNRALCMLVFTLDCCYIFNPDPREVERKKMQKAPYKVMDECDLTPLKNERIAKMLVVKRDINYLKELRKAVAPLLDGKVTLSFSSNRYMECNAQGIDKGYGLKWLADYLHVPPAETIGIGDNYNDVPMIKAAGIGACVASSADDIKDVADYVCQKDYGEGAVAEVLDHFVLGEQNEL